MAKKKKQKKASGGGANIGLILTLIFFVLATFIAGTLAYFGYNEQEQFKNDAKKAADAAKAMEVKYRDERVRKVMLRIALGADTPDDRILLVQELEPLRTPIREEYENMLVRLQKNANIPMVPDKTDPQKKEVSAFTWRLLSMTAQQIKDKTAETGLTQEFVDTDPDVAPVMTLPEMITVHKKKAEAALAKLNELETAIKALEKQVAENKDDKTTFEKTFNDSLAKIDMEKKQKFTMLDADFQRLAQRHNNDGKTAADRITKLGADVLAKTDELSGLRDKILKLEDKIAKYEGDAKGGKANAISVDTLNKEEKKGIIFSKGENGFVTINIGSAKRLKPQVTFLIVSADVSWLALEEKEKTLIRDSYKNDRPAYEGNPYVKAGIEVVEVTGPESARAKITFENEPIRNPVQIRDQIFNLAWTADEEIRVAFAGIIDLDGDGLDNNEDFMRVLERQGVIVDEYMRMRPMEFVKRDGRGMSLATKYLIIAPDPRLDALPTDKGSPQTAQIQAAIIKLAEIKQRAGALGVQMIEARKFLAMIGYKLPKNPSPPAYGAGVYIDGNLQPAPEMKKDGN